MQITKLRVFLVNPGHRVAYGTGWGRNLIFVKIYTDKGIDGLGEAFATGKAKPIEATLLDFERWLVGKDPVGIIRHWQALYRGARYPLGTASMAALSAVEQALWDIVGKSCGLPIYKMLGGPCRDWIRLYASCTFFWELADKAFIDRAKELVRLGFTAIKFNAIPDDFASKSSEEVFVEAVERVRAVREAVGNGVDIGLDYHGRSLSPSEAIRLARALEPYHPFFLEEPALSECADSLCEVKSKTTIPIAAGERCVSRNQFRELVEKRAVHIVQPEPTANGGILETIKQAAMAEMVHITVAPHQTGSPVSLLACAHIDACITNFKVQEYNLHLDDPCIRAILTPLPVVENGHLKLPEGPGLGITLNEEATKEYPHRPFDRPIVITEDGSIGLE